MKIFAMITTAASRDYTPHALRSFFRCTPLDSEDTLYLIDNDRDFIIESSDQSRQITRVFNRAPLGFAANMNQVIEIALRHKADLYLLNNDLIFTLGWIEPLLSDPLAIISPLSNRERQYSFDGCHLGTVVSLDHYLGREEIVDAIAKTHREAHKGYLNVFVVPFFCTKIPYQILVAVGFLDETFGKGGGEDFDYCLRALLKGYRVRYALSSYVLHFGGKSSYSGAESEQAQIAREAKFKSVFREKWGDRLFQLIFLDNLGVVNNSRELVEIIGQGQYGRAVERIADSRLPAIHLPNGGAVFPPFDSVFKGDFRP